MSPEVFVHFFHLESSDRVSEESRPISTLTYLKRGSSEENEFHICVRICGVEGPGKSLSGQFFFVCEKDDREESSTKSLGA